MIINSIEGLKLHLGRAINQATTLAFIQPYIQLAQDDYILPAIGAPMLAELDAQYNSVPASLSPANKLLIGELQRALAFYTYAKYLPFSLGNDGDNGLQEQSTEKSAPVRMGVLDKRQRESAENAASALERALLFLHEFAPNYPTWRQSEAYKTAKSLFVHSATGLTRYLPQAAGSYRLLLTLKPYLNLAERNDVLPLIGAAQFDALKALMLAGNPLTVPDKRLLDKVAQASATVGYAKALYYLNVVQTSGGGLRVLSDFDGIYNQKAADPRQLDQAQRRADSEAAASMTGLKAFLTAQADAYPLYKNSDRFTAEDPNAFPDNSAYKGIFRMR